MELLDRIQYSVQLIQYQMPLVIEQRELNVTQFLFFKRNYTQFIYHNFQKLTRLLGYCTMAFMSIILKRRKKRQT